jgi:hypothetical protein
LRHIALQACTGIAASREKIRNHLFWKLNEKRQNVVDAWSAQPDLGDPAELITPDQKEGKDASKKSITDARKLLDGLPESLRAFADKGTPGDLLSIYHKTYVEELLAERVFANPFRSDQRGKSGCGYSANAGVWYAATNHLE